MVEPQPSKLAMPVRSRSPAPLKPFSDHLDFAFRGSSVHGLPSLSHPKRLIPGAIPGVTSSSWRSNLLKGSLGLANSQDDTSYALPPAIPCWIIRPRSVLRLPHPARRTSLRRQRTRLALRGGSRKQGSCSTRGVSFGSLYGQFGEDLLSWNGLDSTAENFSNADRDRTSPCIVHRLLIYDLNRVQQPQGHVLAHRRRQGQTRLVKLRCA